MSRCFPFPPPGYERKHRPEDLDLLKEVKCKEKKHKKEKKDKEKNKDKEKKEKDGNDEKHRDKKDRKGKHKDKKEKHKDKKKDKEDRAKDKEKSSISEESAVAGKPEEKSGENLHPKGHSKDRSSFLEEGRRSLLFQGQNGGKPSQSNLPSQGNEESKFVQELDRRIEYDKKGRGSQLPERAVVDKRNASGLLAEEKSDNKNKRVDKKMDPQGFRNGVAGHTVAQNRTPVAESKVEGIPKPGDEQNGRWLEGKEKYKETGDITSGNKQKDWDKEKRDKEKEKRRDDKAKVKIDNKKSEQDKLKEGGRNDPSGFTSTESNDLFKNANTNAVSDGKIKKRKDTDINGFLHESEIRPSKVQKPASHLSIENGRKVEPFRTPNKPSHDKHDVPNSARLDNRDRLMNGTVEAQKPSPAKPNPSAEASKIPHRDSKTLAMPKVEDPIAKAPRRPPHPDSKYLAEVLTVPLISEWPETDDQEWLFTKKDPSNKYKTEPVVVNEDPCVWSEAVQIESVDVCALPYVIPY